VIDQAPRITQEGMTQFLHACRSDSPHVWTLAGGVYLKAETARPEVFMAIDKPTVERPLAHGLFLPNCVQSAIFGAVLIPDRVRPIIGGPPAMPIVARPGGIALT